MFERFTDRARRTVVLAQEEARLYRHPAICTEHILIGLVHEGEGVASVVLHELGMDIARVREFVDARLDYPEERPTFTGHIPFTPRAKKIFELALREALQLGHSYIGTEHILLGLIRQGDGLAVDVIVDDYNLSLSEVRADVIRILNSYSGPEKRPDPAVKPIRIRAKEAEAALEWIGNIEKMFGPFSEDHPMIRLRNLLLKPRI